MAYPCSTAFSTNSEIACTISAMSEWSAPISASHSRSWARTVRAALIVASSVMCSGGVGARRCIASRVTSSL
ncbi:Uncharacterised protein [Mycobacterium tuberculosis]|nr:Uncharacterised protein [Mycobacterium tuberculosis]